MFLVGRDRSLMQNLFRVSKRMKEFKLWDPKENKVVINRDVIFDEKSMLQITQEKEKQVPKNCSNSKQVVQVELETNVK